MQGLRRSGVTGGASGSTARRLWRGLTDYIAAPDPRAAAANRVAILVALNQPFYPLYVRAFVGDDGWVTAVTLLSTPFFAVIPAVTRRFPVIGRAMLPLVGAANTMATARAVGSASGVELFLFPCAMAAAMAFGAKERGAMLAALAVLAAAYFGLHDRWGAPWHTFPTDAYARFLTMNIVSVAGLTVLIALQFAGADESRAR